MSRHGTYARWKCIHQRNLTGLQKLTRISPLNVLRPHPVCLWVSVVFMCVYLAFCIYRVTDRPTTYADDELERLRFLQSSLIGLNNVRQDTCDQCFRHDFAYLIRSDEICRVVDGASPIKLLILIFTTHARRNERDAIRQTWLSPYVHNKLDVRYAFLFGTTLNVNRTQEVIKENEIYGDIIVEDFVDSYENLTYKTIMGFKWALTYCAHAKYILKTDDDMWVNIPALVDLLDRGGRTLRRSLGGHCPRSAEPIRSKNSKWYASVQSYPRLFYPGYCSGTGYITSMHVVSAIYRISPNVPFFHLEDVYVSLCMEQLKVDLKPIPGFIPPEFHLRNAACRYRDMDIITVHEVDEQQLFNIWTADCSIYKRVVASILCSLKLLMNYTC